jgi:hypothetical protein
VKRKRELEALMAIEREVCEKDAKEKRERGEGIYTERECGLWICKKRGDNTSFGASGLALSKCGQCAQEGVM